jgi:hypothetical protein
MATYKVIQDIEAEDKLVGPLSLRQFIYGAIAAFFAYLSFVALTKGVAFLLIIFGPIMLFTGFFAAPLGRDQPTEVWALAKIRYFIKPRRRLWDQSGAKDLVNITAPKQINKIYTNGLTQTEVRSRLKALANTIDSRGWIIKNVNANLYDPTLSPTLQTTSDRLISPNTITQEVSQFDILASDDILDESNNPVAQNLDRLVRASSTAHRQKLVKQLSQNSTLDKPAAGSQTGDTADYWFLNQPMNLPKSAGVSSPQATVVVPGDKIETATVPNSEPVPNEAALAEKLKANRQNLQAVNYQHMKVIQPINAQAPQDNTMPPKLNKPSPVTPSPDPAKMLLATRNDLNIATIGRIVNKQDEQSNEVVISLHDHAS